ncbi:hypothetical protein [Actinokineospora sp. NPDC004072]
MPAGRSAEEFLFTTRRQPDELAEGLRLVLAEGVHIGWSQVWQESRKGVLVELPQRLRMAVMDLCEAEMATPEQGFAEIGTDDSGEVVHAARVVITQEGRRLLELLEGT